jgi:altronate hydrolase
MQHKVLKVHPADNVIVALVDLAQGETVMLEGQTYTTITSVKAKHKMAAVSFEKGAPIYMYGVLVGKAKQPIAQGEVLTTDNVSHQSAQVSGKTETLSWTPPVVDSWKDRSFMGYHRADGQVGTANVWLFFPLVFCENKNIEKLKEVFDVLVPKKQDRFKSLLQHLIADQGSATVEHTSTNAPVFDNIEVKFITHQGGCGGIRQDSESLARLLAGYVNNPNVAGATVLSLGCQNLQVDLFKKTLEQVNPNLNKEVLIYEQQKMGTVDAMLETIIKDSFEAIKRANQIERKPAPLSKLRIGLECGGSDGFSGISANPVLGHVSDVLVALGGTSILSEFPELCGVEQELVNRCVTDEKAQKFLTLMKAFEKSVVDAGSGFDMNPSPGNIKDGLITDAMKSAGAAKKGGTSPVVDVLDYGEYVSTSGLNLLNTPGNDVESTTAMVGSGATVVLFTTGLGTPTGNPIAPVIKVSSNTTLAERMPDIIDVDAGAVIRGSQTIEEAGNELLEYIIAVASGDKQSKAGQLGQDDFIPWKRGVSL